MGPAVEVLARGKTKTVKQRNSVQGTTHPRALLGGAHSKLPIHSGKEEMGCLEK